MTRLPSPNGDDSTWGSVLNDYLAVEHNNDGTHKTAAPGGGIADATTTIKGRVRLAGDLGGTADTPTVPALGAKAPINGAVFSGSVTLPANPSNTTHAATKAYVDSTLGSGGSGPVATRIVTLPNSGASLLLDLAAGDIFEITLTTNCSIALTNMPFVGSFGLILHQDASGGRTVTFSFPVAWPANTPPALASGAQKRDDLTFLTTTGGNVWYPGIISDNL